MDMNLDGFLDYKWEDSIADVQIAFNNNDYKNIKRLDDSISAEFDFNDFPAVVGIDYFNNKMYRGYISLKSLEKIEISEFYEIEDKLLQHLIKKYGEVDETEYTKLGGLHFIWEFKNNCSITLGSYFSGGYSNLRTIVIAYRNDSVYEEKMIADEHKKEEERSQWFATNKELLKGKLKTSYDEFYSITWINSTYRDEGSILEKMYVYIGKSDDRFWLRLVINHMYSYDAYDGPLYLREYLFNIDGSIRGFKPTYDEIKFTHRSSYTYYENMDINIEGRKDNIYNDLTELLKEISNSNKTIIRFRGSSRHEDREITEDEKQGIKTIMLAYEYLDMGGKLEDIL
jgi:hypothetical protein